MKLSLLSIENDRMVRLSAEGSITAADFRDNGPNPLEKILGAQWFTNRVLLDLDKTSYIDSCAIGWLIKSHKEMQGHGGMMVLYGVPPSIRQVLKLLRIDQVVPLADTETAARVAAGVKS